MICYFCTFLFERHVVVVVICCFKIWKKSSCDDLKAMISVVGHIPSIYQQSSYRYMLGFNRRRWHAPSEGDGDIRTDTSRVAPARRLQNLCLVREIWRSIV